MELPPWVSQEVLKISEVNDMILLKPQELQTRYKLLSVISTIVDFNNLLLHYNVTGLSEEAINLIPEQE